MKLTLEERKEILDAVKEAVKKERIRRAIERVLHDNAERINKYSEEVSGEMNEEILKVFPL